MTGEPSSVRAEPAPVAGESVTAAKARLREPLDTAVVAGLVAILASVPEWRTPGFYFHDDMQIQYVPAIVEIGRAARSGQFAVLSEYSWFGGALAGEYQHGVFSLVHVVLCALVAHLSPPTIACVMSLTYYALAGAGAYRAARVLDFRRPLALAIALVAALNGFNVMWGSWLPAITGWAWLMWLWWALERLRRATHPGWGDVALAAFSTYSVLSAGWHFADLLIAPLIVAVVVRYRRPFALKDVSLRFAVGPLAGLGLAAPALLCFFEYARRGARTDFDAASWAWTVPWSALKGLFVPLSSSRWSAFGTDAMQANAAMAGGVLPVIVVLVALAVPFGLQRRTYLCLVIAGAFMLVWSMLPSLGRVRWPFRWLPVVHLLFVLAGARVISLQGKLRENTPDDRRGTLELQRQLLVVGIGAGLIALSLLGGALDADSMVCAAFGLIALAGLPIAAARRFDVAAAFCGGIALNLLAAPLLLPVRAGTPTWPTDRCSQSWAKVDHAARYLAAYYIRDIIDAADPGLGHNACLLPGNSSMFERVTFVNGYSTLYVAGLHRRLGLEVHGDLNGRGLIAVTGTLGAPGGLLDRWGIDGVVIPAMPYLSSLESRLTDDGFVAAEDLGAARIWRRPAAHQSMPLLESLGSVQTPAGPARAANDGPSPLDRDWTFDGPLESGPGAERAVTLAALRITLDHAAPTRIAATVRAEPSSKRPGVVLVRRPWLPGYRATLDETPLAVGRLDETLLGVVIPAGASGRLRIEYVPLGICPPALIVVVVTLLVLGAGVLHQAVAKPRS